MRRETIRKMVLRFVEPTANLLALSAQVLAAKIRLSFLDYTPYN